MKMVIGISVLVLVLVVSFSVADHPTYISDSDTFRPVYSTTITGNVSPDNPLRINAEIRDSETGFIRVYAWGENGSNWNLTGGKGTESYIIPDPDANSIPGYPKVLTMRNLTNEYLVLDPGLYPVVFSSDGSSGNAEVVVVYIYQDQIDMGLIENQSDSVWETHIPAGLERVIGMTESRWGTDLNLFVQKGTNLPDSFINFTYNSTGNCTDCWGVGIEDYLAEMLVIDNPEPGTYQMVTKADGGDDFFHTYWMGIEKKNKKGDTFHFSGK